MTAGHFDNAVPLAHDAIVEAAGAQGVDENAPRMQALRRVVDSARGEGGPRHRDLRRSRPSWPS